MHQCAAPGPRGSATGSRAGHDRRVTMTNRRGLRPPRRRQRLRAIKSSTVSGGGIGPGLGSPCSGTDATARSTDRGGCSHLLPSLATPSAMGVPTRPNRAHRPSGYYLSYRLTRSFPAPAVVLQALYTGSIPVAASKQTAGLVHCVRRRRRPAQPHASLTNPASPQPLAVRGDLPCAHPHDGPRLLADVVRLGEVAIVGDPRSERPT